LSDLSKLRGSELDGVVGSYLVETDLGSSLSEALSANIQGILADDGVTVGADSAREKD
jgi:hypothetical protein